MDPVGALIGLAEVALALAGFSAIVLVLSSRTSPIQAEELAFVRIMVSNGVGMAFSSLIAVSLLALEIPPPRVWVLASGIVFVGGLAVSALNFFVFLRGLEDHSSRLVSFWWSFVVVGALIHLVNALGLFAPPSFGAFFLGLVVLLSQAGVQFVYLLYAILGRSEP